MSENRGSELRGLRFMCEACEHWYKPEGEGDCPFCGHKLPMNVTAQGPEVERLWRILHMQPKGEG